MGTGEGTSLKKIDVVGAVIQNEKKEILCALRSQQMSMPGMWEFPGGKIEEGEKPEQSLRREIKEELSVQIEVGELITDVVHDYPAIQVHLFTYHAKIASGVPQANEHEKLLWLPIQDLLSLHWAPADMSTVYKLLGKNTLLDK